MTARFTIAVSPGELFDKLTVLEIKAERMTDPGKLAHVNAELKELCRFNGSYDSLAALQDNEKLDSLVRELKAINVILWDLHNAVRRDIINNRTSNLILVDVGGIHSYNDKRHAIKRRINELLGSEFVEEKEYVK